jgi:hypothetical protein
MTVTSSTKGLGGRLLVRLAAMEASRPRGARAPGVGGGNAAFGVDVVDVEASFEGEHSTADVADLIKSGQYRIDQIGKAYVAITPTWLAKDPKGYGDFTADWTALQARWVAAKTKALTATSTSSMVAGGMTYGLVGTSVDDAWTALLKAMKQGGDGAQVQKGDLDDLDRRLTAAGGRVDYSQMPQPHPDAGLEFLKNTAWVPNPEKVEKQAEDWMAWLQKNQKLVMMVGLGVVGLVFFGLLASAVKALPVAAKVATAGVV